MAAYGGPLMELIRLPSAHRIFFRASVYEASPGACFARATGRRIKYLDAFLRPEKIIPVFPITCLKNIRDGKLGISFFFLYLYYNL